MKSPMRIDNYQIIMFMERSSKKIVLATVFVICIPLLFSVKLCEYRCSYKLSGITYYKNWRSYFQLVRELLVIYYKKETRINKSLLLSRNFEDLFQDLLLSILFTQSVD